MDMHGSHASKKYMISFQKLQRWKNPKPLLFLHAPLVTLPLQYSPHSSIKQEPNHGNMIHEPSTTMDSSSSSSINHHPHPPPSLLSLLAVFKNVLNQELIRSVHAYGVVKEEEAEERELWVEREFLFSPTSYIEITAPIPRQLLLVDPMVGDGVCHRPRFHEGQTIGLWLCILAFDSATAAAPSQPLPIPPILSFSRNPRLKSVPTLSCDLQKVFELRCEKENREPMHVASEEIFVDKGNEFSQPMKNAPNYDEDRLLHCCPMIKQTISENQQTNGIVPEVGASMKKKRAATEHVASISLTDLVKYFNLPIAEASKNLNVGLTVLKRKCREFGIPRWPHRKIKSLDTLIHSLQEEVHRQEKEDKAAAARAATKRKRMLETEKEGIERSPFMELQGETKRFRQDVFKRRHKEKVLSKKCQQLSPEVHNCFHS